MNQYPIKILLIEDNPGDIRLIQEMLGGVNAQKTGATFEITPVERLSQALPALNQHPFELILADLSLPDSQGLETISRILQAAPQLPVVVMSDLEDQALAVKAVKIGAQDYLVKGYTNEYSLPRALHYAIERKRGQDEVHRRNRELALLNQIIAASAAGLEPLAILEIACRELAITFKLPHATAALLNEARTTITVTAEFMVEERQSNVGLRVPIIHDPAFQYLLQQRTPLVANQAQQDPRLAATRDLLEAYGVVSLLILPLIIEDEVAGSLSLEAFEPHHFSPEEINLAWSVADQVAGALARAQLAQTQQRLVAAIEQVTENVVITDTQGKIIYVNPGFERLTGYNRVEVVGQNPRLLKSNQQEPEFYQEMWATVSAGKIWQGRLTNRKKDGSLYVEDMTITPVRDHEGQITNYVAVKRDMTRELQLEEQYHQVISSLSDHIYVTEITAEGQQVNRYISPNVESLTGYPFKNFTADWGFWPTNLIYPEDRPIAAAHFKRLIEGVSGAIEYRMIRADGQIIWVRDSGRTVQEGSSKVIYGVVGEITARKQREHELKVITEIAADLRAASGRADIPPIVVAQLLNLLQAQGGALGIYDPARQVMIIELAEGRLSGLNGLPLSPEKEMGWQVIRSGQPYLTSEAGSLFTTLSPEKLKGYAAMAIPLMADKQIIGALWMIRQTEFSFAEIGLFTAIADITANALHRATLFETLQRTNAELVNEQALLSQRVAERTAELSYANAELARAARLKDEFLASMSHELRTPLNTILGMAEVLREEVYGSMNEQQLNSLRYIDESGQHLLALITDILDLSKIEAGKLELSLDQVPVETLCQASLHLIRQQAQKKQIKVSTIFDGTVTTLQADQRRLKQILVNLLSNAVKFTPEYGRIGLEVKGNQEEQQVHFTIWDTGIGISPENMGRLFQPFVQLDSSLSRQYEGTGLGLSLVSRLAQMHGGGVSLESEVGKGSRFTVSLPWHVLDEGTITDQPYEAAHLESPAGVALSSESSALILLAEDNVTNILTMQQYLQIRGYQVIVARNGAEAIKRAFEQRPDLILMDVQMPVMDGLEATRRIRAEAELASTPIIAVTALAMPGDRERCLEAGVNEYITKPINFSNLVKIIEAQLAGRGSSNGQ